jgi:hypothetical protein
MRLQLSGAMKQLILLVLPHSLNDKHKKNNKKERGINCLNKSAIIIVKNGIIKSEQGLLLRLQFYSDALGVD